MTEHKHAEMIKVKADNMELVLFFKADEVEWRKVDGQDVFPINRSHYVEYFLCHPKHADVCLHWLNGGEVEVLVGDVRSESMPKDYFREWRREHIFMRDDLDIRIKPRKEKRWIGIYRGEFVTEKTMGTLQDVQEYVLSSTHYKYCAPEGWQFIQIEVEVK